MSRHRNHIAESEAERILATFTDDDFNWIKKSDHPVAARIRFWTILLASWPYRVPPMNMLTPYLEQVKARG